MPCYAVQMKSSQLDFCSNLSFYVCFLSVSSYCLHSAAWANPLGNNRIKELKRNKSLKVQTKFDIVSTFIEYAKNSVQSQGTQMIFKWVQTSKQQNKPFGFWSNFYETHSIFISLTFGQFGGKKGINEYKTCFWPIVEKVRLLNAKPHLLLAAKMIALPSVHAIEATHTHTNDSDSIRSEANATNFEALKIIGHSQYE